MCRKAGYFGGLLDPNMLEKCIFKLNSMQEGYNRAGTLFSMAVGRLKEVIASSKYAKEIDKFLNENADIDKELRYYFFNGVWDYIDRVIKLARDFNGKDLEAELSLPARAALTNRGNGIGMTVSWHPDAYVGVRSDEELEEALNEIIKNQRSRKETLGEFLPAFRDSGLPQDVLDSIYGIIKRGVDLLDSTDEQQSEGIQTFANNVRDAWNATKNAMKNAATGGSGRRVDMLK